MQDCTPQEVSFILRIRHPHGPSAPRAQVLVASAKIAPSYPGAVKVGTGVASRRSRRWRPTRREAGAEPGSAYPGAGSVMDIMPPRRSPLKRMRSPSLGALINWRNWWRGPLRTEPILLVDIATSCDTDSWRKAARDDCGPEPGRRLIMSYSCDLVRRRVTDAPTRKHQPTLAAARTAARAGAAGGDWLQPFPPASSDPVSPRCDIAGA